MRWPILSAAFERAEARGEQRAQTNYAQAVAQHAERQLAGREAANVEATAAVQTAAALYESAFLAATWSPDNSRLRPLSPAILGRVARALILRGECVFRIATSRGQLRLIPASSWTLTGAADPVTWRYELLHAGPTTTQKATVSGAAVLHFRRSAAVEAAWRGCSPVALAGGTGRLLAETEHALADESAGTRGHLLAIPKDGRDSSVSDLRGDIGTLAGKTTLIETTSHGWGEGRSAAPLTDWRPMRIGANPPPTMEAIRSAAGAAMLAALGVPPSLAMASSDGTAQRESFRRWLHAGVQPLGRLVALEASEKLDVRAAALSFRQLGAADVAARTRAYGSLIKAGMDPAEAARVAGVE